MTIARRGFVKAGGFALASLGIDPRLLGPAGFASPRSEPLAEHPVLVCIFLRGAVDGLSMIVPHGDSAYYRARPRTAVPRSDVVDLDGYFGLHPRLAALQPLWDNKSLAVIPAIGSPVVTRSHLDAQEYLESGTPGVKATPDGWLNRYCQHNREQRETPFRAAAFGREVPRILAGRAPSVAIGNRRANFGQVMLQIAQLIKADVGLQVAFADLGGWDTHVNQGASDGRLAIQLDTLGSALVAFAQNMGERMRSIVVLTLSEFGRSVHENDHAGTDDGHGTTMLAFGGPVNGGRIAGCWPGLDPAERFEERDVAVTTDFRDLCCEILARHLRAQDLSDVFPGFVPEAGRIPGVIRA